MVSSKTKFEIKCYNFLSLKILMFKGYKIRENLRKYNALMLISVCRISAQKDGFIFPDMLVFIGIKDSFRDKFGLNFIYHFALFRPLAKTTAVSAS